MLTKTQTDRHTDKQTDHRLSFPRACTPIHLSNGSMDISWSIWLNSPPPILGQFCPLFVQIAQMGLILSRWGCPDGVSFCPEYHHQPLFLTQPSQTPFFDSSDTYVHKTPPTSPPNALFLGLNLKVANQLPSGQFGPQLGKMFEKWAKLF